MFLMYSLVPRTKSHPFSSLSLVFSHALSLSLGFFMGPVVHLPYSSSAPRVLFYFLSRTVHHPYIYICFCALRLWRVPSSTRFNISDISTSFAKNLQLIRKRCPLPARASSAPACVRACVRPCTFFSLASSDATHLCVCVTLARSFRIFYLFMFTCRMCSSTCLCDLKPAPLPRLLLFSHREHLTGFHCLY